MKSTFLFFAFFLPIMVKAQTDTTAKVALFPYDETVTIEFRSDSNRRPVLEMYVDPIRFDSLSKSERMEIIYNIERWIRLEKRKLIPRTQ